MARLLGAVLAGGRSSRFGSDKALARLPDGRTLLDHAIAALSPHVATMVICGRSHDGMASLVDRPAPGMGPLGGINAALHHALEQGFTAVLTTGCDMPVYPAALVPALVGEGPAILEGQPLLGYWPAALAPLLDAHLAGDNNRSVFGWLDHVQTRIVALPGLVLPNINRPADFAAFGRHG